mgnify:CR=1 FL=1
MSARPPMRSFRGLFDDIDLNSNKLGNGVAERNSRLVKIIKGIAGLDFGNVADAKMTVRLMPTSTS